MKKKTLAGHCHHKWTKSYEERVMFDDGVGEHTTMRPKWTCTKCGKISWVNPNT